MNISGITSTSPALISDYNPPAAAPASDADLGNVAMMASVQVMNMAQDAFNDVAARLVAELSALTTGIGQNVDMYV